MDIGGQPVEPKWVRFRVADLEASTRDLPPATDDWPFLYTRKPSVPEHTVRGMVLMVLLSLGLWWATARAAGHAPAVESAATRSEWGLLLRSFFLGAGFMLVETKAVVHMALLVRRHVDGQHGGLRGRAAHVAGRQPLRDGVRPKNLTPYYVLLFVSLLLNVLIPIDAFLGLSPAVQVGGACLLAFAPVAFAGIVFAASFARSSRPNQMFGANVAGALVGGLAENASMLLGFRYLILVAAGFYLLSSLGAGEGERARLGNTARLQPCDAPSTSVWRNPSPQTLMAASYLTLSIGDMHSLRRSTDSSSQFADQFVTAVAARLVNTRSALAAR